MTTTAGNVIGRVYSSAVRCARVCSTSSVLAWRRSRRKTGRAASAML
ncbi:hypothetical protein E2C01_087733 [Portunus trituberculatus]|uniref:Uncharacterized protein n=1 Tax=Portunus trituberculatus TaxID=210409 RepID=A0A5B7J8Y7_PORTR|nr:hypothetical protein [Portunus trituberculatus]